MAKYNEWISTFTDGQFLARSGSAIASDLPASAQTSLDPTGYEVLTSAATDVQTAFDQTDAALIRARSTGLQYGGNISNLGSGVVRIAAGSGGILDNSTPSAPVFTQVTWPQTDLDLHATNGVHYIYVSSNGTVSSTTTEPTHGDYRLYIWLHRVSILSNLYSASTPIPMPVQQYGPGQWDIWEALGSIKYGLDLSANGANLQLNIAAGEAYQAGSNFYNDPTNPHEVEFTAKAGATIRLVTQNGTSTADRTTLDPGKYDVAGTVTAIPGASTRSQIWTVKMFLSGGGRVRVFYGQTYYNSVDAALAAIQDGTYAPVIPVAYSDAITLGWIVTTKGATALNDGTQVFVTANKFGLTGGSVASAGDGALLAANNLSDLTSVSSARSSLSLPANNTKYSQSVAAQGAGFSSDTYLTGSSITVPSGGLQAGTRYKLLFDVSKTGAGTAAPVITVRFGTNGTTADAAILAFTFAAGTADADVGTFEVTATFRTVGSGTSAVLQGTARCVHSLSTTGLQNVPAKVLQVTSSGFDSTVSNSIIGASVNGGTSASWTVQLVQSSLENLT